MGSEELSDQFAKNIEKSIISTKDLESGLEIPIPRVQVYLRKGYLTPSVKQAAGRGTSNRYSLPDCYKLILFEMLSKIGFPQKTASIECERIDFNKVGRDARRDFAIAIVQGDDKWVEQGTLGDMVNWVVRGVDMVSVIDLARIKERVNYAFATSKPQ
jgi:hypothetical protein